MTGSLEARLREATTQGGAEPCHQCAALRQELGAGLGDALQRTAELAREVSTLRQERDALRRRLETLPTVDGGTLASHLIRLTDDQWLLVQRGRAQLAEARDLRAKAAALEADGARILEGLLDAPSQAPAEPAPEPVPDPTPEPPPEVTP